MNQILVVIKRFVVPTDLVLSLITILSVKQSDDERKPHRHEYRQQHDQHQDHLEIATKSPLTRNV